MMYIDASGVNDCHLQTSASSFRFAQPPSGHLVFNRTALSNLPSFPRASEYPVFTMSAPSITNYIVKRPWLKRWMTPLANWYTDAAGYRKLGLKFDDLIPEESEVVQKAIKRLPSKEAYDRVFRIRRAFQVLLHFPHSPSPNEQIKPHEDVEYLSPIIREIEKENKERDDLDNLVVRK
ncbi:Cytochrome b-c1 complex subunit 7 [Penicillium frequentans]|uniref:Complex III subunit 7 n=1 Tax=Penicillium frequentans TaxID=3151616 RepID=A0AAD6GJT6_9EURO|nr:Cytochrome b-c1 complex subunit 7 [Penicillium glabrum]